MSTPQETKNIIQKTLEAVFAELGVNLGTTKDEKLNELIAKKYSVISKREAFGLQLKFGIYENHKIKTLKPYIFNHLDLSNSVDGIRSKQVVDVLKSPYQIEKDELSYGQRLKHVLRLR